MKLILVDQETDDLPIELDDRDTAPDHLVQEGMLWSRVAVNMVGTIAFYKVEHRG